jgi:hypothetical protein
VQVLDALPSTPPPAASRAPAPAGCQTAPAALPACSSPSAAAAAPAAAPSGCLPSPGQIGRQQGALLRPAAGGETRKHMQGAREQMQGARNYGWSARKHDRVQGCIRRQVQQLAACAWAGQPTYWQGTLLLPTCSSGSGSARLAPHCSTWNRS